MKQKQYQAALLVLLLFNYVPLKIMWPTLPTEAVYGMAPPGAHVIQLSL